MSNIANRLDVVWASMSTADRFVLLGHDRAVLDRDDKARLAHLMHTKANRAAADRRPRRRRTN